MRTIIDLPEAMLAMLTEICQRQGISRAEAVRRAVDRYITDHAAGEAPETFGMWADRRLDALAYEDDLRGPRDAGAEHPPTRPRRPRGRR
jgi:hypothetical protein